MLIKLVQLKKHTFGGEYLISLEFLKITVGYVVVRSIKICLFYNFVFTEGKKKFISLPGAFNNEKSLPHAFFKNKTFNSSLEPNHEKLIVLIKRYLFDDTPSNKAVLIKKVNNNQTILLSQELHCVSVHNNNETMAVRYYVGCEKKKLSGIINEVNDEKKKYENEDCIISLARVDLLTFAFPFQATTT